MKLFMHPDTERALRAEYARAGLHFPPVEIVDPRTVEFASVDRAAVSTFGAARAIATDPTGHDPGDEDRSE